jgi:hypothetical protein
MKKIKLWSVVMFYPHDKAKLINTGERVLSKEPIKGIVTEIDKKQGLFEVAEVYPKGAMYGVWWVTKKEITEVLYVV